MKWFKHDSDAARDTKLCRVRAKYGMVGYGLYWYCLELIASKVDARKLTFELEHDCDLLALETGIHRDLVQEMMRFMVEQRLFDESGGIIRCLKMAARTDEYTQQLLRRLNKTPEDVPSVSGDTPDKVPVDEIRGEETRGDQKRLPTGGDARAGPRSRARGTRPPRAENGSIPYPEILETYNALLGEYLPGIKSISGKRAQRVRDLWHHTNPRQALTTIEDWSVFCRHVRESDFLCGRAPPGKGRTKPFRADFDWLIATEHFARICEGSYHD